MIHVVVGTKAQLIKMAPVMRGLADRGIQYNYIATGQHHDTMAEIHENFGIRLPDAYLYQGPDITTVRSMARWASRLLWTGLRERWRVFLGDKHGLVLVHGDTFSTLLGACMARLAGLKVGHVESGLRSFDLRNPFPEELIRRLTFGLSHVYLCPGDWAVNNLKRHRGVKVNTLANTLADSLRLARKVVETQTPGLVPSHPYGIVSIHRFENIGSRAALERVVFSVKLIAQRQSLLFVLHQPTEQQLRRYDLLTELMAEPSITFRPRYDYFDFIRLIRGAEFVVSDGGSNQEECFYLGKPLLLLREVTERKEGLGTNAVLSRFERDAIERFRNQYRDHAMPPPTLTARPTEIILDAIAQYA